MILEGYSADTLGRLRSFVALLEKWNPAINLVSPASLPLVWSRHIADSAQLLEVAPPSAEHWVDLGAGAGFPGAAIAIISADSAKPIRMTLIECDRRKAVFLRTVSRETGITMEVIDERIEDAPPQNADVVSARALAPVSQLATYASRHLRHGGTALFLKGVQAEAEISSARSGWTFQLSRHQSTTDETATVLEMKDFRRV